MSDITVAPPGGGASSAAPSSPAPAHEVQINQNPQASPNPVGPQAPTAPVGDIKGSEHRPPSRREAIQAAIKEAADRANNPPPKIARPTEKQAPKPAAEARPGHNQPPEETPKFDLKKRPPEGGPPAAEAQPRERGRFAPRQADVKDEVRPELANAGQPGQPDQQPYKKLPSHAPFAEPPGRIAEHARRDWADTPETVRGEIHRMNHEFGKAVQHYRGAAEAFQPIARFHQMAQQGGTTLETALNHFVGIEDRLRKDPIGALDQIVHNLGMIDPETKQPIGLRDVAYHVLSQSPEQLKQVQQGNAQTAAQHQIGALHQKVDALERQNQQMQYERQYQQRFAHTRSAVDQFAATHPRIDEPGFGETVKNEITLGFDIDTAYRRAELLHPATHAAQTRTPPAQTRPTDRSIYGNPDVAPSNGASRRPKEPSPNPRAALQNAMNRLNGAH